MRRAGDEARTVFLTYQHQSSSTWRILRIFRDLMVQNSPWNGVLDENLHLWNKHTIVLQAGGDDADDFPLPIFSNEQGRATLSAKSPDVGTSTQPGCSVPVRFTGQDLESVQRDHHDWKASTTAKSLAVPAVAAKHPLRIGVALVAHPTTGTTADQGKLHGGDPLLPD